MLAEFFEAVCKRLDTRFEKPTIIDYIDPATKAVRRGFFSSHNEWKELAKGLNEEKFPNINVFSSKSLVDYATSHAIDAIDESRAMLTVNKNGLRLMVDYGAGESPERIEHRVYFPAAYDEECEGAAAAIKGALGKWIELNAFDTLLDKCAPFITNFTALEEAASNMEGHETAKIAKTATKFQVMVQGEVSCAVDIPKVVQLRLLFMGNPISADVPLRLTVENKQVKFHLVDNGALAKAQMEVLRTIKAEVIGKLPKLLVIDGIVGN